MVYVLSACKYPENLLLNRYGERVILKYYKNGMLIGIYLYVNDARKFIATKYLCVYENMTRH